MVDSSNLVVTAGMMPSGGQPPPSDEDYGDSEEQYSALKIEQRGIDHIPAEDRHTQPWQLFFVWGSALFTVSYVIYGAFLIYIGLSLLQAIVIIILGNVSYLLVGAFSLQGPKAGTSSCVIDRAAFGFNGGKLISGLNWLTVIGYEVTTAAITVLAALALFQKWGLQSDTWVKVLTVLGVGVVQALLPFFGHAMLTRILRILLVPFAILFVLMAILMSAKISTSHFHQHGSFVDLTLGFALTMSVAGLGWANMGNDYSRYMPANVSKSRTVLAVTLGGGIPSILLMVLGAVVATTITSATNPITGLSAVLPTWFIVPYLIAIIPQTVASNSINMYSSGLTLQAAGIRISRPMAIVLDSIICFILTTAVILSSKFNLYVSDFLLFTILWLAPWAGVFGVDVFLRKGRYNGHQLLNPFGIYRGEYGGFNVEGVVALFVGIIASSMWIDTSIYKGPLSSATGGSDFSALVGMGVGALVYAGLRLFKSHRAASDPNELSRAVNAG